MSNMVVRTNVLALNSHRNLGMVGTQQARASQRLSSGFRINSAADDAAGLGISEKMRSQIRGLNQASRNAQDGISLIQTAEGAMSTINEMIARIRELVVQAANDTNAHDESSTATWSQSDRTRIQGEIDQLLLEIDATVHRTQFNTRMLIDGSLDGAAGAGFEGDALDAFPDWAFTGNALGLGELAGGMAFMGEYDATDVAELFQSALMDLLSWDGETTSLDGAVTTWLVTMETTATADLAAAGVTNLATLFSVGGLSGDNLASQEAAQEALMEALNGVDLSRHVAGTPANAPANLGDLAITGNLFTANALTGHANIDVGTGFEFDEGRSAEGLRDAIEAAVTDLVGTNVTTWLETYEAASGTDITDAIGTTADVGGAGITNLQQLMAYGAAATRANETELAVHDLAMEAHADLLDAINDAIAAYFGVEPPDTGGPGNSLWFQVGANKDQGVNLNVRDVGVVALSKVGDDDDTVDEEFSFLNLFSGGRNALVDDEISSVTGRQILDVDRADLSYAARGRGVMRESGEDIQKFLTAIDFALSHATAERSNLGAMQNRLEFTIQNLDIASENLSASESRIRDADMALEMMRLTQANVLQQAATAMLAQANQAPQSILQLLG